MISKIRHHLQKKIHFLQKHEPKIFLFVIFSIGVGFSTYVYYPRAMTFAYSGENCTSMLLLAPTLYDSHDQQEFSIEYKDDIRILGKRIASTQTCVSPRSKPQPGINSFVVAPFSLSLYGTQLKITVPEPPYVRLEKINPPLPTQEPLLIPMTARDTVHAYSIAVDKEVAECDSRVSGLLCDIPSLSLDQGTAYDFVIKRSFQDEPTEELTKKTIETLSATTIVESSVEKSEVVYEKPKELRFTADKSIESAEVVLEIVGDTTRAKVPGNVVINQKEIIYQLIDELPRDTQFLVTVDALKATDSSSLRSPYTFGFSTSGGPRIKSVNIGAYRVNPGTTAVVTLDQNISELTDISAVASVDGLSATITGSGNTIRFSLGDAPLCSTFTLKINGTLISAFGVEEKVSWQYPSRFRCHTITTIGYSVQGRAISAYSFGSGEPMLFIGAMHGNERSSGFLMDRFIDDLEANYFKIPSGRRVVVVPHVNPDAFHAITRRNANNVDLNRNFPTDDWKSDVTMPGGTLIKGGGGSEPLSEPESKAIANFTTSLRPILVLTYHAVASNVIANEAGISWEAAKKYAELSGYQHVPKSATNEVFEYDTNGAYEDWLYEKQGIATLLIELSSMSYSQFERNKPAMWAMLTL